MFESMFQQISFLNKVGKVMKRLIIGTMLAIIVLFLGSKTLALAASPFLKVAAETGIDIVKQDSATIWAGPYGGKIKPIGPLLGCIHL